MNATTETMLRESVQCFANDIISEEPGIGRVALIKKVRERLREKIARINQNRSLREQVGSTELWLFFITTAIRLIIEIWKYRRNQK